MTDDPLSDLVRIEFVDPGDITPELTAGLVRDIRQVQRERDDAIARQAQVQVLRELRELFRDYTNALPAGSPARRAQMVLLVEVVARLAALEARADDLEQQ